MKAFDITTLPLTGQQLIEASAGTGKTYSIERIYLRLLLEKEYSVQKVLVVTFTNAATAELKNRLSAFLQKTFDTWQQSTDPVVMHLRATIAEHKAKLLLRKALAQLDESAIYTIHGFCKRVLTEHAFHSGTSFSVSVENDNEALLLKACRDWYRNHQLDEHFSLLANQWPTPETFLADWRRLIIQMEAFDVPELNDLNVLHKTHAASWQHEAPAFSKQNKARKNSAPATLESYERVFQLLSDWAHAETPLVDSVATVNKEDIKHCFGTPKKMNAMPNAFELINRMVENQKIEQLRFVAQAIAGIREGLTLEKQRADVYTFDDLISQLNRAILSPENTALLERLRDDFPAALIDEFQDTDQNQYEIFNQIYLHQAHLLLCMIGDPKQAIYAFRGGDVFAYLKAREQASNHWTMSTNYRSAPDVVHAYNRLFADMENTSTFGFDIAYQAVSANPNITQNALNDLQPRSALQWVQIAPQDTSEKINADFRNVLAAWCANECVRLLSQATLEENPVQPSDIVVLVRSASEAEIMQQALINAGLQSVFLSTRDSVFQTSEAEQLAVLLNGIWFRNNTRKFIGALSSQWLGVSAEELLSIQQEDQLWSDWQNQFDRWRDDWQRRGILSMLLSIVEYAFANIQALSERQLANRLHLAELMQQESSRIRKTEALIHWLEQQLVQETSTQNQTLLRLESDENLVRIVTMHSAKGLEYPIVFLPFASYFGKTNKQPAYFRYHERKSGAVKLKLHASDFEKALSFQEDEAERIRLLYVAVTRAMWRCYLCLADFRTFKESAIGLTLANKFAGENTELPELVTENLLELTAYDWQVHSGEAAIKQATPQAATFNGQVERDWWLASFSSLIRHTETEQNQPDRDELSINRKGDSVDLTFETATNLPLRFAILKGAETGNLLHDSLEHLNFNEPDWQNLKTFIADRHAALSSKFNFEDYQRWMTDILTTPFHDEASLSQLTQQDTLREAEFYFPMPGQSTDELLRLVNQFRGDEPLSLNAINLKGMMHGFIDLIFRWGDKYYVADYKSNHLGNQFSDYTADQLWLNMMAHHYDVQYSIYAVALHKFLTMKLPDYSPAKHFGGVYYFYLRGMHPNNATGIFHRKLDENYLLELERSLGGDIEEVV